MVSRADHSQHQSLLKRPRDAGVEWSPLGQAAKCGAKVRPCLGLVLADLRHRGKACDHLRSSCPFLVAEFREVSGEHPVCVAELARAVEHIPSRESGTAGGACASATVASATMAAIRRNM